MIIIFSIFTIIPFEAGAISGVSYFERSWDGEKVAEAEKTCDSYNDLKDVTNVQLTKGWYVLSQDATFEERLTADSGMVNLILCDGAALTANKGIGVGMNATLNIYGQSEDSGRITVTMAEADSSYAAIGGTDLPAGNINIHGGTMDLTNNASAVSGAGIGGCASCSVQTVSIYGGDIKATVSSGAGIGGGYDGRTGVIINRSTL